MVRFLACFVASSLVWAGLTGCQTAPTSETDRMNLQQRASTAVNQAQSNDPSLAKLMNAAAGYAVFPSVGKGAIGVGGAYGKGVLYQGGRIVGYCDLSQADIGFQLGGQAYTEIICFETTDAVNRFKNEQLKFAAQATAVALKSGAGANAKYADGVAVFYMDPAGLMYEAAIGGQKFSYLPL